MTSDGNSKGRGLTSWHLVPELVRCLVLLNIHKLGTKDTPAYWSAVEALMDLAPYPDEALAFEVDDHCGPRHLQLIGVGYFEPGEDEMPDAWVLEDAEGNEAPYDPSELSPLTIAAKEALEATWS